jgi:hypothetical protein
MRRPLSSLAMVVVLCSSATAALTGGPSSIWHQISAPRFAPEFVQQGWSVKLSRMTVGSETLVVHWTWRHWSNMCSSRSGCKGFISRLDWSGRPLHLEMVSQPAVLIEVSISGVLQQAVQGAEGRHYAQNKGTAEQQILYMARAPR